MKALLYIEFNTNSIITFIVLLFGSFLFGLMYDIYGDAHIISLLIIAFGVIYFSNNFNDSVSGFSIRRRIMPFEKSDIYISRIIAVTFNLFMNFFFAVLLPIDLKYPPLIEFLGDLGISMTDYFIRYANLFSILMIYSSVDYYYLVKNDITFKTVDRLSVFIITTIGIILIFLLFMFIFSENSFLSTLQNYKISALYFCMFLLLNIIFFISLERNN